MADIPGKDLKRTVFKMLKSLKENAEKVKKMYKTARFSCHSCLGVSVFLHLPPKSQGQQIQLIHETTYWVFTKKNTNSSGYSSQTVRCVHLVIRTSLFSGRPLSPLPAKGFTLEASVLWALYQYAIKRSSVYSQSSAATQYLMNITQTGSNKRTGYQVFLFWCPRNHHLALY